LIGIAGRLPVLCQLQILSAKTPRWESGLFMMRHAGKVSGKQGKDDEDNRINFVVVAPTGY